MSNEYGQMPRSQLDNDEQEFIRAYLELKHHAMHSVKDDDVASIPKKNGSHSEIGIKHEWAYNILQDLLYDMGCWAEYIWDVFDARMHN